MNNKLLFCLVASILFAIIPSFSKANDALYHRLDSVLELRKHYIEVKEQKINSLKRQYQYATPSRQLAITQQLYQEYYTYRFDSAMHYAQQERILAQQLKDKSAFIKAQNHLSLVFATGGYYSEAQNLLKALPIETKDSLTQYEYWLTSFWIYNYWSDYCSDKLFSPQYDKLKTERLGKALSFCPNKNTAWFQYLQGEYAYCKKQPLKISTTHYLKAASMAPISTRTYACAAYGAARNYRLGGNMSKYEEWLVRAAISEQVNPLKENLALQELAVYLFKKDESNAEKSTRYIYCSMEDAQFYNNRLRMLEISQRMPTIVSVYQMQIDNKRKAVTIMSISLFTGIVILLVSLVFVVRQTRKARKRGMEISKQNELLEDLNKRLREVDNTRGKYMRLFMDLCATYIGKMNNYRKLVMRKVKAHQTDDLLQSATSTKLTEQESTLFYTQFDKAFLEIYPNFVSSFNALLKPDSQIGLARDGSLTTEMRIYALVRLGINESVEIATLLFFSPQTIYNYRTAMRKKAINPETFEDEVKAL